MADDAAVGVRGGAEGVGVAAAAAADADADAAASGNTTVVANVAGGGGARGISLFAAMYCTT